MNFRRADSEIDVNDPFKDDLLSRKGLAIRLSRFLEHIPGPMTMALTGSYGSGKTHFLRRCKVLFESQGIPTIIINAWETDFASEPIAPIISELSDQFSGKLKSGERSWKKAKSLAAKLAAASVPIGIKLATAGILEAEDFKEASGIAAAAEKFAEKQFEHFAAAKKSIDGFKKELAQLTDQIRQAKDSEQAGRENWTPPVVVIIDELDRCRPSYAIELLEVLKHFFDIHGIVFLLGIDRTQLVSAARAVFGAGLDGDGYLRRFIDLECSLPQPDVYRFCLSLGNVDESLEMWRTDQNFHVSLEPLGRLCQGAKFSLRKTHQFLLRAVIAAVAAGPNGGSSDMMVLLVFLREYDPGLYDEFVNARITAWDLLLKLRALDKEFGYPSLYNRYPFISFLAAIGREDSPKPFLDLLEEDYALRNIKANVDFLRQSIGGWNGRHHLRQLLEYVDFCAAFEA